MNIIIEVIKWITAFILTILMIYILKDLFKDKE